LIRLSKKVEYALLAVQYIAQREGSVVSAKEIAEAYNLSFELVSKVLQSLIKAGFVRSYQGAQGGYTLTRRSSEISVGDVVVAAEGKKKSIVECAGDDHESCYIQEKCTIRHPLAKIQEKIDSALYSMSISEMIGIHQISI